MTDIAHAPHAVGHAAKPLPAPVPFDLRLATGLCGVLFAALMSGFSSRVGALALADVEGVFGLSRDTGHLLGSVYTATELAGMFLSPWFAVTFSFRKVMAVIITAFLVLALAIPVAPGFSALIVLRGLQGLAGGAMIPLLMAGALRFLPPAIKLHGLGLYTLTATFAPYVSIWLSAQWVDVLDDWRLIYWQSLPLGLIALGAVLWGLPQDPLQLRRLRELDWPALIMAPAALILLAVGFSEGERLDWTADAGIQFCFAGGALLLAAAMISEWFHHIPFVRLQLLARRNLWVSLVIFGGLLVVFFSASMLPAAHLAHLQGFRDLQVAPLGLAIGLPQLVLAPLFSAVLYIRWMDARWMMAGGILLVALACWLASGVTAEWMAPQFRLMLALQMVGQPMAVIGLLHVATSAVVPMEGPFFAGLINAWRGIALAGGGAFIGHRLSVETQTHAQVMADRLGRLGHAAAGDGLSLSERIQHEAFNLAVADSYRLLALVALALLPFVALLHRTPAPIVAPPRSGNSR